jgi:2-haloacid dehalogenase
MSNMQAGCAGAFVARPGKGRYPLGPIPDIVGPDLEAVANRILAVDQRADGGVRQ